MDISFRTRLKAALITALIFLPQVTASAGTEPRLESQQPWLNFSDVFLGTIGPRQVRFILSRDSDKLSGRYYFLPNKTAIITVLSVLFVKGQIDASGNFTLRETTFNSDNKEIYTGDIKGVLRRNVKGPSLERSMEGSWSAPDSSKTLPFAIKQQTVQLGGDSNIFSRGMRSSNKKLTDNVSIEYPEITGLKTSSVEQFNTTAKTLVAKSLQDFTKLVIKNIEENDNVGLDITYEIQSCTENLISILFYEEVDFSRAHPNHYRKSINFDLKTGRPLQLSDLFRPGAEYSDLIVTLSNRVSSTSAFKPYAPFNATNILETVWYLTDSSIMLNYELPFALGANAQIVIPYSDMKEVINLQGPLAPFMKATGDR